MSFIKNKDVSKDYNKIRNILETEIENENFIIKYSSTGISFDNYVYMINETLEKGFNRLQQIIKNDKTFQRYDLKRQGEGIIGNVLVATALLEIKEIDKIIIEPKVEKTPSECTIPKSIMFDVGFYIKRKDIIGLIEVKLHKKGSESNIPEMKNIENIYSEYTMKYLIKYYGLIVFGIILEMNSIPKNINLPPYILRENIVCTLGIRQSKKPIRKIKDKILNFLEQRNII